MGHLLNKIDAHDRSVEEVLDNKKYTVDFFQREYKWEERHIEQLISDLTTAFNEEYRPEHSREEVENYNSYYLGPFVVCEKDGKRSIIDGQQRLTSLTLLLIYLNNLQKDLGIHEKIETLIFSEKFSKKSFNIQVDERTECLERLFTKGEYQINEGDDESTINMAQRYLNIADAFPEELKNDTLPYFIDWLKYRVILVEIIAYSDENAYLIFETMNDRGLNLTPTEMLKGYILSKFDDRNKRQKANEYWQKAIQDIHVFDKNEDQRFIQSWFRAKYADTIRPGKAGSKNEDFEKIGTRFHSWFRENLPKAGIINDSSAEFEYLFNIEFKFFYNAYFKIRESEEKFKPELEHVYYIKRWGIASSLSYPMMLAPLNTKDSQEVSFQKIDTVAKFIESFVVRRSVNFRLFSSSSIRYTMYSLVKDIRGLPLDELKTFLAKKLDEMPEKIEGIEYFRMHGQNRYFIKFLLSRLSGFIESQAGLHSSFEKFFHNPGCKTFEVEHIWADKFLEHSDEFTQENEFSTYRNRLGDLVLLPRGNNQSYGAKPYKEKLPHYIKENLLVQTLCPLTYVNNPNFLNMKNKFGLLFEPHEEFKKKDIDLRQKLYLQIAKLLWN